MKEADYIIISNIALNSAIYEMRLKGDTGALSRSGQFIDVAVTGKYLRRPISVCDYDEKGLTIVYKVVGEGTAALSRMRPGESVNALCGLGNGFDDGAAAKKIALVGGGVGLPPLYGLAKRLKENGAVFSVLAGFNSAADMYYTDNFRALCGDVRIATADGSFGTKGFVTSLLGKGEFDYFYACGPLPMLKAIMNADDHPAQLSFEERMGCGFGACMGCTVKVKGGYKRICKDGPVLVREEVIW